MLDAKQCVQIREWKAHKLAMNSVREIECHPFGFITTSQDKHVKVWSTWGVLWGDIYLPKENYDKNWLFPFDWSRVRRNEVDQARQVLR